MRTKQYNSSAADAGQNEVTERDSVTIYCVLHIDRYSNRVLESVYLDRRRAEAFRNQSPHKLYIEPLQVFDYDGEDTLWCSNEWGPGDVLSFLDLHTIFDDASEASELSGRPSPVRIADKLRVPISH